MQTPSLLLHSTTYQVYHFQSVSSLDRSLIPAGSRYDLEISLHRHAIAGQVQPFQQCRERQAFRHFASFTVQLHSYHLGLQTIDPSPEGTGSLCRLVENMVTTPATRRQEKR